MFNDIKVVYKGRLLHIPALCKRFTKKTYRASQMRGLETKWRKLREVAKGTETGLRGLEVILQIWRHGGKFCGAHGSSAPSPSTDPFY